MRRPVCLVVPAMAAKSDGGDEGSIGPLVAHAIASEASSSRAAGRLHRQSDTDERHEKMKITMMTSKQLVMVVLGVAGGAAAEAGALEEYVQRAEARFAWTKVDEAHTNGCMITHLALTSQTWRDDIWTHTLRVVRPDTVRNADIGSCPCNGYKCF